MKTCLLTTIALSLLSGCATPAKQNNSIAGIEIDGERWIPVKNFTESAANDKHYVIRRDEDGTTSIIFGDGKNGARLPSGTSQIKMTYRRGGGRYSRVRQQQGRVEGDDCK